MQSDGYKFQQRVNTTPPAHSTPVRRVARSSTLLYCILVLASFYNIYAFFDIHCIMHHEHTDYSQNSQSIFLPFVYRFSSKHVPQVMCKIEGVQIEMPVDTGSTGLLVGAPILPNIDPTAGEPAHHFFTSSLILYVGRLVKLPVIFPGDAGSSATATVPVLIVDKSWRCPWYDPAKHKFECPPGPHGEKAVERDTSKITYMGVGFGRNCPKDGMPIAAPQVNPFLNIEAIDGLAVSKASMRSGYVVTTEGISLGLTPKNTRGFVFEKLQPGVTHGHDPRDWSMATMCFSVDGEGSNCGAALIDTGISQMYIRAPADVSIPTVRIRNPNKHGFSKLVPRVKPGTKIAVGFPTLDAPANYSFAVGDRSLVQPSYVVPGEASNPAYINTGRNFLRGYSIAFDAVGGRFGLRAVHASSSSVL